VVARTVRASSAPAAANDPCSSPVSGERAEAANRRARLRLLIVEDSALIRKVTRLVFPSKEYELTEAANGLEALAILADPEPIDPSAVNLAGEWVLSDIHRPIGGTTPAGTMVECHIDNVPVAITASDTPGLFRAEMLGGSGMLEGGTQQCEIGGEEHPPESPQLLVFFLEQQGPDVIWRQLNNAPYYIGTLSAGNQMSGTSTRRAAGERGPGWRTG
jgi:CheY-like chemotaxis protein